MQIEGRIHIRSAEIHSEMHVAKWKSIGFNKTDSREQA